MEKRKFGGDRKNGISCTFKKGKVKEREKESERDGSRESKLRRDTNITCAQIFSVFCDD